jgi:tRNA G18 (ribose-2'-O)-methylase SpoU
VLSLATELNIPVRQVESRELDTIAHGATHGGVVAIVSPKPRTSVEELMEILDRSTDPPLLLLLEGID